MWRPVILTSFLVLLSCEVDSARILGVFPMPSKSHQVVFRSYTQELARRGHELVIITPDPVKNVDPAYNVTHIDVSIGYEYLIKLLMSRGSYLKRGVIMSIDAIIDLKVYLLVVDLFADIINLPQVQELINDKSQKFDLIIAEGFLDYHLILSEIFKAPVILFPSFMGFPEAYEMMGATGRHPILYPNIHRRNFSNLSFFEMLSELYYEAKMLKLYWEIEEYQNELLKKYFGPQTPTVEQLRKNVDLLFLNSYPMFANNRPIPPNVHYIGATHLNPRKEIPKVSYK